MKDQEILEKAIEKAIDGGWTWLNYSRDNLFNYQATGSESKVILNWQLEKWPQMIIFNPDFAKALVGNDIQNGQLRWKNFLQYLVIQNNPVKALEKFL